MLRNKGNMRRGKFHDCSGGPFLRRAMWGGGGGEVGGGMRGCFIFKKIYTLYILEVHIGTKRILHI